MPTLYPTTAIDLETEIVVIEELIAKFRGCDEGTCMELKELLDELLDSLSRLQKDKNE